MSIGMRSPDQNSAVRRRWVERNSGPASAQSCRISSHWRPAHVSGPAAHGLDDILIARAAAEIGRQDLENLLVRQLGIGLQRIYRKHQKPGCAKAALERMVSDEGVLHGVQFAAVGETFDRSDTLALGLDREHQTGSYRVIVEDHRASTADAVLATDMRPGQPAFVADDICQRLSRLDPDRMVMPV